MPTVKTIMLLIFSPTHKGNLQCEGETLFEQKDRCHYDDPELCRPTAKLILEKRNISSSPGRGVGEDDLCTCKFRGGQRVCADSELMTLFSCFG